MLRSQHQAYGARREIVECTPGVCIDEQSLPRMVQQHGLFLVSVIERDMKRTTESYHELLEPLVGMTTTALATRNIINPVSALNVERHHRLSLSKCQIATRISNLWHVYYLNIHYLNLSYGSVPRTVFASRLALSRRALTSSPTSP